MKSSLSHVESETLATRDHGKGFSRRGVRDGHNGCAFRLIVLSRRSEDRFFSKSVGKT